MLFKLSLSKPLHESLNLTLPRLGKYASLKLSGRFFSKSFNFFAIVLSPTPTVDISGDYNNPVSNTNLTMPTKA